MERLGNRGTIVTHHTQVQGIYMKMPQHGRQGVAIAVVDLAVLQGFANFPKFIPGREKSDPNAASYGNLGNAD